MTTLPMKYFFSTFLAFAALVSGHSQSLKPLDYRELMERNAVKIERVEVVSFNEGQPIDTCLLAQIEYNERGLMIKREDYFSGGRKLSVEEFYYNHKGQLDSITLSHVFDQFRSRSFRMTFSSEGKIVQRELETEIRNSWVRERFEWDSAGRLKEIKQFRKQQDQLVLMKTIDFTLENKELLKESPIMYVRADNGLLLVENVFGDAGVKRMLVHSYDHF